MGEPERWDAVVIGSGLGGLACAAYLCAAGRRTLVLERHYVAGGNSQVFRRRIHGQSYEFDVGVHYIGECGRDGLITTILHGLGLAERVIFRPLDPDGYSTIVLPDLSFRVPVGWDRYRARLLETFPDEAEPLGEVVDILRAVAEAGRRYLNREVEAGAVAQEMPVFLEWGLRPVTTLFDRYGLSRRARAVLLGEQGDYAVRPSRTPVAMAAGLTGHYMSGAFYPQGGGQAIPGRLIEAIRAYGGEVRTRAPVSQVWIEAGRPRGVKLTKGGFIEAPVVVSNADLKRTVLELVGAEHFSAETVERVRAYRMALPLFAAYLGLDVDLAKEGVPNTTYWVWGTDDIEAIYEQIEAGRLPKENFAFLTVATIKDPVSRHLAPEGHSNLQVMTLVPPDYDLWNVEKGPAEGGRYHRDPAYRQRKAEILRRLIAVTEELLPAVRGHIVWQEAATPVTQERFTLSTGGTSYGIEFNCEQAGPLRMGPTTEIPGLYLCGASTPSGHGIGSVLRSGVIAAGAVLETDLLALVRSGQVIGDRGRLPELRDDWDAWRESH
ncbi:MAG: phytoene desaturase family protein [Myxococcota bacterium]